MAIAGLEALATNLAETGVKQQVGISVLKKALNIEAASAATLINAIAAPSAANLPANLGQNINTTA